VSKNIGEKDNDCCLVLRPFLSGFRFQKTAGAFFLAALEIYLPDSKKNTRVEQNTFAWSVFSPWHPDSFNSSSLCLIYKLKWWPSLTWFTIRHLFVSILRLWPQCVGFFFCFVIKSHAPPPNWEPLNWDIGGCGWVLIGLGQGNFSCERAPL